MTQGEGTPARQGIFRVTDTRYRREIQSCLFRHILEDHRAQRGLVTIEEELPLKGDDGLHRYGERMPSHPDGLDEVLGSIHFLLDVEQRLLGLAVQMLFVLLIFIHGVDKRLREGELRHFTVVEGEGHGAIILRFHNEVGRDLLQASSDSLTHRGTWSRIQFAQFAKEGLTLLVIQGKGCLYASPMLMGELVEVAVDDLLHQLFHTRVIAPCNLQEQAFL